MFDKRLKKILSRFGLVILILYSIWFSGLKILHVYRLQTLLNIVDQNHCTSPCWSDFAFKQTTKKDILTSIEDKKEKQIQDLTCRPTFCYWYDRSYNMDILVHFKDDLVQQVGFYYGDIRTKLFQTSLEDIIDAYGVPDYFDTNRFVGIDTKSSVFIYLFYERYNMIVIASGYPSDFSKTVCEIDFPWELPVYRIYFVTLDEPMPTELIVEPISGLPLTPQIWNEASTIKFSNC